MYSEFAIEPMHRYWFKGQYTFIKAGLQWICYGVKVKRDLVSW